jgi:hypothetical protein
MSAASELAAAAAEQDSSYKPLAQDLDVANQMVASFQFSDADGQRALTRARELCAQI